MSIKSRHPSTLSELHLLLRLKNHALYDQRFLLAGRMDDLLAQLYESQASVKLASLRARVQCHGELLPSRSLHLHSCDANPWQR